MSIDTLEFLLGKLAEEANEVSHIALKTQLFGLSASHPDTGETNIDALARELNDLLGIVKMIQELGVEFKNLNHPRELRAKEIKVWKMLGNAIKRDENLPARLSMDLQDLLRKKLNPPPLGTMDNTISVTFEEYNDSKKTPDLIFFIPKSSVGDPCKMTSADSLEFWRMPKASELFDFSTQKYSNADWISCGWVMLNGRCTTLTQFLKNSGEQVARLFFSNAFNCISVELTEMHRYSPFDFVWE